MLQPSYSELVQAGRAFVASYGREHSAELARLCPCERCNYWRDTREALARLGRSSL